MRSTRAWRVVSRSGSCSASSVHFAGVAPIMIHIAETGETVSISGLGCWPKLASVDWFRQHQNGRILANIKRCVVPAAPDSWITALERYGTMSFADVAASAIRFGREGFGFQSISHEIISESADTIARWPQNAAIYLPGGEAPKPGQRFLQTDLANSIQYMADQEAAAAAYGGPCRGSRRRACRILPRRYRAEDCRVSQGKRRLAARRRPVAVQR